MAKKTAPKADQSGAGHAGSNINGFNK